MEIWGVKYRPRSLAKILGQDDSKRLIAGALRSVIKPTTWLIQGSHGTGKTSLARVLGRNLVCINPTPEGEACNQCPECQELLQGEDRSLNYLELDSASWGNVDDVRMILDDARLAPTGGALRRVLTMDEAHLLSSKAQASLLKVFEEGLGSTVFLLVTNHPDKVIPTIRSRCLNIRLAPVDRKLVLAYLKAIVRKEKVACDEEALKLLVDHTYGHVRDTLNLAYQISLSGEIRVDFVKKQLNLDLEDLGGLILHRLGENWTQTVEQLNEWSQERLPRDLWHAVLKAVKQAYLYSVNPTGKGVGTIRQVAERYGSRLAAVAEWSLGEGSRFQMDFLMDLIVGLALIREKLGIEKGMLLVGRGRKLGPSKLDLLHRGAVQPATIMTEENIASFFDLSLEKDLSEKPPESSHAQSQPGSTGKPG